MLILVVVGAVFIAITYHSLAIKGMVAWYRSLHRESSEAFLKHRRELIYIESLLMKYGYEKGPFDLESFYDYVPGLSDCEHCRHHIEMAIYALTCSNRLIREPSTDKYQVTESAKSLLEYIDEHPDAHALAIIPMRQVYYQHRSCHSDHKQYLR